MYLKDIIYAANDGIITTFAVVAGVAGASLSPAIILILGIASLVADGFSMAVSDYLATKSEEDYLAKNGNGAGATRSKKAAIVTFFSFVIAGLLPILPYAFSIGSSDVFWVSVVFTGLTLFIVGACRVRWTGKNWFWSGLEMLFVGGIAALIAYFVGAFIKNLVF